MLDKLNAPRFRKKDDNIHCEATMTALRTRSQNSVRVKS